MKKKFFVVGIVISSGIFSLLLAEIIVRWLSAAYFVNPIAVYRDGFSRDRFVEDDRCGIRPVFGKKYNAYGTHRNNYDLRCKSGKRLLFIGDSATDRGRLIKQLRAIYGTKYEYWNAGVTGFNTTQEVEYYKKYNYLINPDQVILTFHMNDFVETPVFFRKGDAVVGYGLRIPRQWFSPWLLIHSALYRYSMAVLFYHKYDDELMKKQIKKALADLQRILARQNIRFTVLILPYLYDYRCWDKKVKNDRRYIQQICQELSIEYVDLLKPMLRALADNVDIQEVPGDCAHPGDAVCRYFAKYISRQIDF